jgi:MFS family permease
MSDGTGAARPPERVSGYAWYVLAILFLVYVLNFVDRQIITILAADIKRDLHVDDQYIGFLYGTAFGVFYSLFGIPLGRLADSWHRVRLMTAGLALWSAMTALSGFARTGGLLAGARVGVGVGEATASPAAYSLLSDWFPRRLRATVLAIYSSGLYVGGGCSLFIGGLIVRRWDAAYPAGGPLGLAGWQAAFLAVGVPGLILAAVVATLREPLRGQSEGLTGSAHPRPFLAFGQELVTIIPPLTVLSAARRGAGPLAVNLGVLAAIAVVVAALVAAGEPLAQWAAVGTGVYAVFSWAAALRHRDRPTFALTFGTPAFVSVVVAYGLNAFVAYSVAAFAPTFARQAFAVPADQAGFFIGGPAAVAGFLGITIGGRIADRLRERYPNGRLMVVLFGALAPVAPMVVAFTAADALTFYVALPLAQLLTSTALGASAATTQDLVLPRMRGTATGTFFLGTTLLGLAIGPYLAGRVSVLSGELATGVLATLAVLPVGLAAGIAALRWVPAAEASREARARAAGEAI